MTLDYYINCYVLEYKTNRSDKTIRRKFHTEEECLRFIRLLRSQYFIISLRLQKVQYADVTHLLGRCEQ